ncbi:MAG TPA: DNA polymerase Y family protein [Polyangiaceae bacterium]
MERRIACVALTEVRVEIAREGHDTRPLAVVVARPGGSVQTERHVLGNTRIDCVSREAARLGVQAGSTVAAAKAKLAELRVRVVPVGAVHTVLARLAEAALAFGPTTAFDASRDVVWVDVTGCAGLRGGEAGLLRALAAKVRELGHACRVAVADGPRLAAAVARFSRSDAVVVPEGNGAAAVRALPLEALELDERMSTWLEDLGLSTCGDLQKLPRRGLAMRLGERGRDVLPLLDGRDAAPLDPWRPPEVPEERVELEWGAHAIEALTFVHKTLCDRLAARLNGRALAAARLELVLSLDRALCEHDHRVALAMALPSPMARAGELFAVVQARVEGVTLAAPVLAVTLRASELARAVAQPLDLLEPEPKARRALPLLAAELGAELGDDTVGTLALVDTWSAVDRTRLVPLGGGGRAPGGRSVPRVADGAKPGGSLVTSALEPSRIVHALEEVSREALADAKHLVRVEGRAWWQRPVTTRAARGVMTFEGAGVDGAERPWRHDWYAAWVDDSLAWLELTRPNDRLLLRGWLD